MGHTLFANEASLSEQLRLEKRVIGSYLKTFSLGCGLQLTGSVNIYREVYCYAIHVQNDTYFCTTIKVHRVVILFYTSCVFKVEEIFF